MRLPQTKEALDGYVQGHLGVALSELMAPVGENKVGESVRHNGVYFNIKNARKADDPTLPLGVWSHDLKTADWHEVQRLTVEALCHKCKDLQLGVWLLEANIHLQGFAGVAPAVTVIQALCEQYWEEMHPQMVDGDLEYRTNPFNWVNDKLTPKLKLISITDTVLDGEEYNWEDWENGLRYEQLKAQKKFKGDWHGPTPKAFKKRLTATSAEAIISLNGHLLDGLSALRTLQTWLDERCAGDSPSLGDLTRLLVGVQEMIGDELRRRGLSMAASTQGTDQGTEDGDSTSAKSGGGRDDGDQGSQGGQGGDGGGEGPLRHREDAFLMLRRAADFLMEDDPHSPVPYLVYAACDWGEKSAPDLYQQLFLQQGGQLNIFQLMGLEVERQ